MDTKELIHCLTPDMDLDRFFLEHSGEFIDVTVKTLLNEYLAKYDLRVGDVAQASGQGEYVYKVFSGTRKASRDILISISVGLGLALEETQLLLRVSQFAMLDPRNRRDSILIFAINSGYDINRINDLLAEKEQSEL